MCEARGAGGVLLRYYYLVVFAAYVVEEHPLAFPVLPRLLGALAAAHAPARSALPAWREAPAFALLLCCFQHSFSGWMRRHW